MNISCTVSYQAAPAQAADILLSKELADVRAQTLGISNLSYEGSSRQSAVTMTVAPAQLPEKARSFVKNGVHVTVTMKRDETQTDTHFPTSPAESKHSAPTGVSYTLHVQGLPVKAHGHIELTPNGFASAHAHITGSLNVAIPFVGKKIEALAGTYAHKLFEKDAELVNRLLQEK